jgi:hypothetical protein
MSTQYVTKPISCDGKETGSIPVAHLQRRICQATGKEYWTVDADPNPTCFSHSGEAESDMERGRR